MELSARPFLKTGIAFTMASAIALSPVIATNQHPLGVPVHLPQMNVSEVHLAAVISPSDVAALTANLNAALEAAGSTVTALVDNASHTLTSALSTASGLNTSLWDQLIAASAGSPTLKAVLVALKASSGGALLQLTNTVGAVGDGITLTTGQVAELLTSAITGTVATVAQAVASVVNNPLAASSYIGLLNTPFGAAGLALQDGLTGLSQLGTTGLHLVNDLVHGVTAQVSNALDTVNHLIDAGKTVTDITLINGTLTAIQGIVSAPVRAIVAGVDGIASAVTNAGVSTLNLVAGGANAIVGTWLGSGSTPGAVIKAISAIGQEPLSLGSYTHAVSILVGALGSTAGSVANTVTGFASMPFRFAADLTGPGAQAINALVSGVATAASGLLRAAGLSPLIAGLPNNLATVVTGAVTAAALATKTTLNAIATAIDVGHTIGGWVTSSKSAATAVTLTAAKAETTSKLTAGSDASGTPAPTASRPAPAPAPARATDKTEDTTPTDVDETVSGSPKIDANAAAPASGANQAPATSISDTSLATNPFEKTNPGSTPPETLGKPTAKPKPSTTDAAASTTDKTAETYGRHAAPPRQATTGASDASTSGTDTSSSESGGRHRRDDSASRKNATTNDGDTTAHDTSGGGRHAAGKHAAAA